MLDAHAYYPHDPCAVDALAGVDLLTEHMLNEVWAGMFDGRRLGCVRTESTPSSAVQTIPTLVDLTLDSAFDQAIASNSTRLIEILLPDPMRARRFRARLRRHKPFPSNAVGLLIACTREDPDGTKASMDLSGYDLSTEQVLQLLASHPRVEALNLCFNECITACSIPKLLEAFPSIRRLVLIGCNSIQDTKLFDMLQTKPESFYNLDTLLHPSLMRMREPLVHPVAFTIACSSDYAIAIPEVFGCCLPVFTPTSVVQSLIDFTDFCMKPAIRFSKSFGVSAAEASFTATRRVDQPFDHRSFTTVPYFLRESLIPGHPSASSTSWMYIYQQDDGYYQRSYATYAFLKCNRQVSEAFASPSSYGTTLEDPDAASEPAQLSSAFQAYDLRGFIEGLIAEGRPPVAEELVTKLSQTLLSEEDSQRRRSAGALRSRQSRWLQPSRGIEGALFMTQTEVDHFTRNMMHYATGTKGIAY